MRTGDSSIGFGFCKNACLVWISGAALFTKAFSRLVPLHMNATPSAKARWSAPSICCLFGLCKDIMYLCLKFNISCSSVLGPGPDKNFVLECCQTQFFTAFATHENSLAYTESKKESLITQDINQARLGAINIITALMPSAGSKWKVNRVR